MLKTQVDINEYYNEGGSPKRCPYCGSSDFINLTTELLNGVVCEYEIRCKRCNAEIGYFAYGSYDPSFREKWIERIEEWNTDWKE